MNIPETAPSLSRHGAPIGGIWVFSTLKITVIRQVCVYCGLSLKTNMCEMPRGAQRSWAHFVCVCSLERGRQKHKYSNWSSMADEVITRSGIGVPGCPF